MHNRFVIPVMVATALHALVFFGFDGSRTPSDPNPPPITPGPSPQVPDRIEYEFAPVAEETEVNEVAVSPRKGSDDVFRPQTDEPAPTPSDWTFTPEPIRPGPITVSDRVTPGMWGDPKGDDEGGDRPIVSISYLDNHPKTLSQIAPVYPAAAKARGDAGEVLVEFVVDESGRVIRARVVKSTDAIFEAPTLKAVEKWRFEPGKKNGRAVPFRMVAPVVFSLEA